MVRKKAPVISNWYRYGEGFSPSEFAFYAAIMEAVNAREVPCASLSQVYSFKAGL